MGYVTRLAIIAVASAFSIVMLWWLWPESNDRATIDTLERIGDAELSKGNLDDDRDVILDWLRKN